ncbi:MAG: hypothetical protein E7295_03825 [Lachnospiraceae bacterium]|nr:hypothetical protein [Lachnospiraceae bacterium]
MVFIISDRPEIIGSRENMLARRRFIKEITGVDPSPWKHFDTSLNGFSCWICMTKDGINGLYVTAHNYEVRALCRMPIAALSKYFIANTCIYFDGLDDVICYELTKQNKNVLCWYAKQEVKLAKDYAFHRMSILRDVGTFGFMTSKSDRLMFRNRAKGFEGALELSFDRVIC